MQTPYFRPVVAILSVLVVLLPACGGGDDEKKSKPTVFKKQESTALKEEGTAIDEKEIARREEEARKKRERAKAAKELLKRESELENAEDEFALAEAIARIGKLGEGASSMTEKLTGYLDHDDIDVRVATYGALAKIQGAAAVRPTLEKALGDDEERVRAKALEMWRKLGIKDMGPVFEQVEALESDVQYQAVKTITEGEVGDIEFKRLVDLAEELDGPASRLVLKAARERGKKSGTPNDDLFVKLLDHQDPKTRSDVAKAAGEDLAKRYAVAKKLVSTLGDDPDRDVRKACHEVLKAWAGAAAPAYDPTADEDALKAAAKLWATWLETHRAQFGA